MKLILTLPDPVRKHLESVQGSLSISKYVMFLIEQDMKKNVSKKEQNHGKPFIQETLR